MTNVSELLIAEETAATGALTSLQEGMVFHALGQKRSGVDIEHVTFELDEHLDSKRFIEAWQTVTAANPVLHTTIDTSGQQPAIALTPGAIIPVSRHHWADFDEATRASRWQDLVASDRIRGFELSAPPLQRLHLVEVDPGHWRGLWSFHHINLDGRSFPLVLRDVFAHYDRGETPPERPSVQRHTQAIAQQDRFGDEVFWKSELDGWEPTRATSIIAEADAAAAQQPFVSTQNVIERRLDTEATAAIVAAAEDLGVSTNTLVQSAWSILLHRYLGSDDVVFGSTRACRHVVEGADEMVGLLINTVPFRVKVDRSASVAELVTAVAATHFRLRQAETSPLHLIKQWANVEADAELFDSLVMFDEQTLGKRLRDLGDHRRFNYDGQTNLPITLLAYADPQMLVRLETRADMFGPAPSQRMLDQFVTVLTAIAADPNQSVGAIDCLTEADRMLIAQFNDTDAAFDTTRTLDSMLRDQAARTPDATALSCGDQTLTYAELRTRVDDVASWLTSKGIGAESVVGVYAHRSVEMIVAIHAIVAAGAAYLPLDPDLPADRLAFMVDDAAAALVISAGVEAEPSLPVEMFDIAAIEETARSARAEGFAPVPVLPTPASAAYVIYTSGSTGQPKGVVNEHGGIVNRLLWMQNTFGLTTDDVVMQKTPFTFDVSVWELFWPLLTGARLHIAAPEAHRDPRHLVAEITSSNTTVMHFVPSMLALFVDEPSVATCTTLRAVICSGEALARDLQDRALTAIQNIELHNLYGPTEAAIDVTWWQCDPSSTLDTVPIGAAIANTRMHVLDNELSPVPPGAVGELFIAGVQVARGYLNRPQLSAERFLEAGAVPFDNGRLYRTGDLGRHREDGTIEYLGRTDHQVKIRGLRIELGEIESVLTNHPLVTNAAVLDLADHAGEKYLAAYVSLERTPTAGVDDELRKHLGQKLAAYMVPAVFVVVDDFPLSSSGKIDRKALPAPTIAAAAAELPVGEIEAAVAAIWCDLLGVDTVDRSTPFFRAGGHSLLIVRLAHALGEHFGRVVEVTSLIDHATVAAQAVMLGGNVNTDQAPPHDRLAEVAANAAKRKAAGRRRRPGPRVGGKR